MLHNTTTTTLQVATLKISFLLFCSPADWHFGLYFALKMPTCLQTVTIYTLSNRNKSLGKVQANRKLIMFHLTASTYVLHSSHFHYCLVISWWIFTDNLRSSMQTWELAIHQSNHKVNGTALYNCNYRGPTNYGNASCWFLRKLVSLSLLFSSDTMKTKESTINSKYLWPC